MKLKVLLLALFFGLVFLFPYKAAAADLLNGACTGQAASSPICQDAQTKGKTNPIAGPNGIVQKVANLVALVAGIAAVVMIMVSGLMFATAGGSIGGQRSTDNPTRAKAARATLINSVIGLVIVALAWTIISFVNNVIIHT